MKNFLYRVGVALARFFYGRNGIDTLCYAMLLCYMVLTIVSSLLSIKYLVASSVIHLLSSILLVWMVFRMLSKNRQARYKENMKFLGIWNKIKKWFKLQKNRIKDIKTHRYFACPNCKNNLRVPKGRGEITITCPVCKTRFDRKT